jgi:hypothetical protein
MPQPPSANDPIVPAKPIVRTYPTPDLRDRIYVEHLDTRKGGYVLPKKGEPYQGREAEKYEGFVFAKAVPSDQVGWVDHFYLNVRQNQDDYNFTIEFPWMSKDYPRVTRTYVYLREDFHPPTGNTPDPIKAFADLGVKMVDYKLIRLEDPVLDSMFVGVTTIYERLPAVQSYSAELMDSVLPYRFRVAVPGRLTSTVEYGPAQPPVLGKGDWMRKETTNSAFRKTVDVLRRYLPLAGVTLISYKLTRDKQVATITQTWIDGDQVITPRATLIEADIDNVGDGSTIKTEVEVLEVFPARKFTAETSDPVPEEFRDIVPTRTHAHSFAGKASAPVLGPTELAVSEEDVDDKIVRRQVTDRDPAALPASLDDYELGGITTHGSEFGGTMQTRKTLSDKPQKVEEGFDITASSVKAIGKGLTLKKVTRLHSGGEGTGPHIEITDPGDSYVDDPAVIFHSGGRGSGATATASVSDAVGAPAALDPGGAFPMALVTPGDENGLFYFIGQRTNGGVWANPTRPNGPVKVIPVSHADYPGNITPEALSVATNRTDAPVSGVPNTNPYSVNIMPRPGSGNSIAWDLGMGKSFKANYITLKGPVGNLPNAVIARKYEVYGYNRSDRSDLTLIGGIASLPQTDVWQGRVLNSTNGWRFLMLVARDLTALNPEKTLYPMFSFSEVEFYGELTIEPKVELTYNYHGDAGGVFYAIGQRKNGGTWANPHTLGAVEISAPYDTLALGTFDSMVDRAPSNTYLVDRFTSEIWFDLGEGRDLELTTLSYQNRSDYNSGCRVFNIQGSNDGTPWEQIKRCEVAYTAGAWTKIDMPVTGKRYRWFRLILPTDKNVMAVGEIEFYGILKWAPTDLAGGGGGAGIKSVTGITVTNPGEGYAAPPLVQFSGGGGSGTEAVAHLNDSGGVDRVEILQPGSGYQFAPTIQFRVPGSGSGAKAESILTNGVVTSINVTDPGADYDSPPAVRFASRTGSGATAEAVLDADGHVASINVTSGGSGYERPPTTVLIAEGDPEADADIGFPINEITLVSGGSGYTSPPTVHISGGQEATAIAVLGFGVLGVQLGDGGGGYTTPPTVNIVGNGSGATATATIAKGLTAATVTNEGSGYLTAPEVQVSAGNAQFEAIIGRPIRTLALSAKGTGYTSDPAVAVNGDGSGATGHATRSFSVDAIAVAAGGSGYTTAPTVVVSAPTGNNPITATAVAELTGDVVTGITITNAGHGYLTPPTVTLTGGGGTGATATATLTAAGVINTLVLDTPGTGYTNATVAITGGAGSGATGVAVLDTAAAGMVKRVDVVNPGSSYTEPPILTIVDGVSGGSGATATTTLAASGKVVGVTVTNSGSGYSGVVTLNFTGGGGSGATGNVLLKPAGSVKAINLINPGSGFDDNTTITLTGGGGAGAHATVSRSDCGVVKSVRLTKPGGPFTVPPIVEFVGGQSNLCEGRITGWHEVGSIDGVVVSNNGGGHPSTLLADGRVLLTGPGTKAQLYDPETKVWSPAADMPTARKFHASVRLADDRVLVFGGTADVVGQMSPPNLTCAIYDPSANSWTATGSMAGIGIEDPTASTSGFGGAPAAQLAGTYTHHAVLLDGRIMAVRGFRESNSCQIYDPVAGTWSVSPQIPMDLGSTFGWLTHRFTTLPNGQVLVTFGSWPFPAAGQPHVGQYCLYDPADDEWTQHTLPLPFEYDYLHTPILLPTGKVLIFGGYRNVSGQGPLVYDYLTNSWDRIDTLDIPDRYARHAFIRPDGKIALVGGNGWPVASAKVSSVFDPATNTFVHNTPRPQVVLQDHSTAELLQDGTVL